MIAGQGQSAANPYLKTKILTASPEELRLMLYEGVLRFSRQGREALAAKRYEEAYNWLMRSQKIVLELSTSLKPELAPELCEKLTALYVYIYRRLVDATTGRELAPLDEAIRLLEYEKQTWELAMTELAKSRNGEGLSGAQQTAISSLSING